jgi:hypothetical protein
MAGLKELKDERQHNSRALWYARHHRCRIIKQPLAKSFSQKALTREGLSIFFLPPTSKSAVGRDFRGIGALTHKSNRA